MVKLIYSDQQGRERAMEVGPQRTSVTIGRNPDCHIQTNNASVSRIHALITWKDGRVYVQDPPSGRPTNGTYIDGMRLQPGEQLELCNNSELKCGNFSIRVLEEMPTAMRPDSPPMQGRPASNHAPNPQQGRGPYPPQQHITGPGQGFNQTHSFPSPGMNAPPAEGMKPAPQAQPIPQGPYQSQGMSPQQQGPYHTGQRQAPPAGRQAPNQTGGAQAIMGVNPEEFNRLLDEYNALRRELDDARGSIEELTDEKKELTADLEQSHRDLLDLESRSDHHDTVVDSLNDMIKHLKEQMEHQKDQLQENKREIVTLEEHNENLEYELEALKQTLESRGMATSNAETTIANLKVQLTQKNRHLTELQRELDLTQYAVKEERENVERLQHNIEELNVKLEESEKHCRDMKKVVEQHEAMFSELRSNIEDKNSEIRQMQNTFRTKGGDSGALLAELAAAKEELQKRSRECDSLKEQLRSAEAHIASSSSTANAAIDTSALDALKEQIKELEIAQGELIKERSDLMSALDDAKKDSQEMAGMPSSAGLDELDLELFQKVYQSVNQSLSNWGEHLERMERLITALQRVFRLFVRIDLAILPTKDKTRLEATLKEYDPRVIFEDIANIIEADLGLLGDVKENLRELRSLMQ